MKTVVRFEEFGVFLFSLYLFSALTYQWWVFPLLLFTPDISMIGCIKDTKIGAFVYNLFHFRALSLILYVVGIYLSVPLVSLVGIILFAHTSLDRAFGYGLKFADSFGHTHLGMIGKDAQTENSAQV